MKRLALALLLPLALYVASPYYALYQLDRTVTSGDLGALKQWVDLQAVRSAIKRSMNKESGETIAEPSSAYIDWLQDGIRRMGRGAVDGLVTMSWIRQQLLRSSKPGGEHGFARDIRYAFFESPGRFRVRVGELDEDPVHFRLSLQQMRWRLTAIIN